nr:flagellar hook assembly protein FlgD [Desulfobulbaceae bacterium]
MSITGVTQSALVQPKDAVGQKDLQKSDFMTLFITQLQYQDPMKPMDSYEMASQLAEFSNMEATMQMSENMEKLLEYQTSQNNLQLLTLLDSEVQISGNSIGVVDGKANPTEFVLIDNAESVVVEIYDVGDHIVWQDTQGRQGPGTYEIEWDGLDLAGNQVKDGPYTYKVKAMKSTGEIVDVDYRTTGKVTGINFEGGIVSMILDDSIEAGVSDIIKVK